MEDYFTFLEEESIEDRIKELDPSLKFEKVIGRGSYGLVAKVSMGSEVYALKLDMLYEDCGIKRECEIQKRLSGIYGIPELIKEYDDAFLMRYIEGEKLNEIGAQSPEFFAKLREIVEQMNEVGVSLQHDDAEINILVDSNGDPWIIDFMNSYTDDEIEDVVSFSEEILDQLESRYYD